MANNVSQCFETFALCSPDGGFGKGQFLKDRILVVVFVTPYRDWQGCVLHFLTWGSGRVTRWQSLSFTSVMVLLMIRVQDTMVLLSPGTKSKRTLNKSTSTPQNSKTQKLRAPCSLYQMYSTTSARNLILHSARPLYWHVLGRFFFQKSYKSFPNNHAIDCFT